MMSVWLRFLPLLGPYRGRLTLTLLATLSRPMLNAAKIYLLKLIVDNLLRDPTGRIVLIICGGYLAIALGKAVAGYVDAYQGAYVGGRVVLDLRQRLFDRFMRLSPRYHGEHRVGESISRLISDAGAVEDVLVAGLTDGLAQILTVVVFAGMLFWLDPPLALSSLLILPLLFGSLAISTRGMRVASREVRVRLADLTAAAEEPLAGIGLVKAFMRQDHERAKFDERGERHWLARLAAARQRAIFGPLSDVIATLGTVIVVYVGARALTTGTLTIGWLVIFLAYLGQLYTPLQSLSRLGNNAQAGLAAAERVAALLDLPPEDDEPLRPTIPGRTLSPEAERQAPALEFEHVTFGYQLKRPVLRDFSLVVPHGAIVALVGASGGGKTTALALAQRLFDPAFGQIRAFGHDLRSLATTQLRSWLAVVPQEATLFMGSALENIAYGQLDAPEDALRHAAWLAGFPDDKLAENVGPRGSRLSGGQRQRVAIARALVRQAPLLIFDEATSALDVLSEAQIRATLAALRPRHTVLVVAHRLSTVRDADLIAIVDHGRVVEAGTHATLLARDGAYAALIRAQEQGDLAGRPTAVLSVPRSAGS